MRPAGRILTRNADTAVVAVGVSGGVDSAVAALSLRDAGHHVLAVFLRLWPGDDPRSCCSPMAEARAGEVAGQLSLPFTVLDLTADFDRLVVGPFVGDYLAGLTPNPCVACNPFRFARLREWAAAHGARWIASGHYARVERRDGASWLRRGLDPAKDQSYMLSGLSPALLDELLLPLGEHTKEEVRMAARRAALPPADVADSQEVCFAVDGYRPFLRSRGVLPRPGLIVDEAGRELGHHQGHWEFTVGQRRGLAIGGGDDALYVLERRAARNEVVVGPRRRLGTTRVDVGDLDERGAGLARRLAGPGFDREADPAPAVAGRAGATMVDEAPALTVQLRYRSPAVTVTALTALGLRGTRLRLAQAFAAAAPGQAAVFYAGDRVVGSGRIASSDRRVEKRV